MAEVDLSNTQSIIAFGSAAQAELQVISQAMLQDVKNKDVGPAGDSLRKIVTTIRGFSVDELDLRRERKLVGTAAGPRRALCRVRRASMKTCRARSTRSPKSC